MYETWRHTQRQERDDETVFETRVVGMWLRMVFILTFGRTSAFRLLENAINLFLFLSEKLVIVSVAR